MIYFKDPRVKLHREEWGAVVRTPKGEVIIEKKLLNYYENFQEFNDQKGDLSAPVELEQLTKLGLILSASEQEIS